MRRTRAAAATFGLLLALSGPPAASALDPTDPLRVTVSTAGAPAGQASTIKVRIHDPSTSQHSIAVTFGDGTSQETGFVGECAPGRTSGGPLDTDHVVKHVYRSSGTYSVTARVHTGDCQDAGDPPTGPGAETAFGAGTLPVARGSAASNGPAKPYVYMASGFRGRVGKPVQVSLGGVDDDGRVVSIRVTDSRGKVRDYRRPGPCVDPVLGWPRDAWETKPFTATYSKPGHYAYRVRLTTAGCDGKSPQTVESVQRTTVS